MHSPGEYGFFFCYLKEDTARQDFHSFCEIARNSTDRPCNFFLSLAQWSRAFPYVIALILPEEYEHAVGRWLSQNNIIFGDTVDGTRNVADFYSNATKLEESENFSRS